MRHNTQYIQLTAKNSKRRLRLLERIYLTSKVSGYIISSWRWRRYLKTRMSPEIRTNYIANQPTMYIQFCNSRKIGRVIMRSYNQEIRWELSLRRNQLVSYIFKELSKQMIEQFKITLKRSWCARIYLHIRRMPGFVKIPLRSILWALRRAHKRHYILDVVVHLPRTHGYCTPKKMARRKKRLQRLRAKRMRYSL